MMVKVRITSLQFFEHDYDVVNILILRDNKSFVSLTILKLQCII